ncbi:hypothetical protein ABZ575_40560, partial [Streptomyces sp. NPDC018347]
MVTLTRPARTASPSVEHPQLETPRYRRNRSRPKWVSIPLRFLVPALLVAGWWIGSATGLIREEILAGPPAVWTAFAELYQSGQLVDFGLASLQRAALGVSVGVIVGLVLGVRGGSTAAGRRIPFGGRRVRGARPLRPPRVRRR